MTNKKSGKAEKSFYYKLQIKQWNFWALNDNRLIKEDKLDVLKCFSRWIKEQISPNLVPNCWPAEWADLLTFFNHRRKQSWLWRSGIFVHFKSIWWQLFFHKTKPWTKQIFAGLWRWGIFSLWQLLKPCMLQKKETIKNVFFINYFIDIYFA